MLSVPNIMAFRRDLGPRAKAVEISGIDEPLVGLGKIEIPAT